MKEDRWGWPQPMGRNGMAVDRLGKTALIARYLMSTRTRIRARLRALRAFGWWLVELPPRRMIEDHHQVVRVAVTSSALADIANPRVVPPGAAFDSQCFAHAVTSSM